MNSCDFRVFLQEFGTTVHLSLPGSVSEKETTATQAADAGNVCNRNITVQKSQCKDHFTSKETAL